MAANDGIDIACCDIGLPGIVLMQVMSSMHSTEPRFMRAVAPHRRPAELEGQQHEQQD